jgi:hypothetical protein
MSAKRTSRIHSSFRSALLVMNSRRLALMLVRSAMNLQRPGAVAVDLSDIAEKVSLLSLMLWTGQERIDH